MNLQTLQRAMWRAVRFDPTPDDALACFEGDERLDAAARLTIYRNMYWYRQVDALASTFPRLRTQLGPAQFTRLCCDYIRRYPSRHAALEWLGHALPDFVAERVPTASATARFEWASNLALLASDPARACSAADVDAATFGQSRLRFAPSLQLVDVDAPAIAALELPVLEGTGRASVALFRSGFAVRQLLLEPREARALADAMAGLRVEAVLAPFGADAADTQAAFEMLRNWFSRQWIGEVCL